MTQKLSVEDFSIFCKKKGFVYPSSEIYGGLAGVYDYGHVGTLLKRAFENEWKKHFLRLNDNFVEIDTGVIMHENAFKASGHLENFFDPIVTVQGSEETYRADHLVEEHTKKRVEELSNEELLKIIVKEKLLGDIDYKKVAIENLNMMFPVEMGPKKGIKAYLRPETAQSPYVNFRAQFELQRKKLPLGLALIGRVFRNEIAPRNMLLRTREVEQAELQIFFNPNKINEHERFNEIKTYKLLVMRKDARKKGVQEITAAELVKAGIPKFYVYHMAIVQKFYLDILEMKKEYFRFYELNDEEKAFYNKFHFDIEGKLHSTNDWVELGGVHYRTDHDLKGHEKISKVKMEVVDEGTNERFIPHVLELSFGVGRNIYALLDHALEQDAKRGNDVVKLPSRFAPYKVAVLPLVKKGGLQEKAREIYEELIEQDISAFFDVSGTVGKRYAREDEKGTAFCVTIDFETIEDPKLKDTVTIRDRDSTEQKRIRIDALAQTVKDLTTKKTSFTQLQNL